MFSAQIWCSQSNFNHVVVNQLDTLNHNSLRARQKQEECLVSRRGEGGERRWTEREEKSACVIALK